MLAARLAPDAQETLPPGAAVAGMVLNGLGCANTPLTLTPHLFAHTPLDLLLRQGVHAERCTRLQRGRTRDELHTYGGDGLFSALARAVGAHEGIDQRFPHLATTRFSRNGDEGPESETQAMHSTHGSSKEPRPDVPQAVCERMVSQEGGVPLARKCGDGNASERQIFTERAEALWTTVASSEAPQYLVADATRSSEDNAVHLAKLRLLTRIPATLQLVSPVISPALQGALWPDADAGTRYQPMALCPYGMAQRWRVVCSQAARERAERSVHHAQQREGEALKTPRFPLQAKRFAPPDPAQAALAAGRKAWRFPHVDTHPLLEPKR